MTDDDKFSCLLDSHDIALILRSMCQSAVQESLGLPAERIIGDFNLPVAEFIDAGSLQSTDIAQRLCTMFSCQELQNDLKGSLPLQHWANLVFKHWKNNPHYIIFASSGSTGKPVHQCHHLCFLAQEVEVLAEHLLKSRTRIVGLSPAHHIYGFLFTILLPKIAKLPVLYLPIFPTAQLSTFLQKGDLLVSFPFFWQALIALETHIPADIHGISSTAPCPQKTLKEIREMGVESIYNIYGSSETGGIGYQVNESASFTLLPFWQRVEGSEQSIRRALPANAPQHGYPHPSGTVCPPFWQDIELPDNTTWLNENVFSLNGRRDSIVQVGGINVSLQSVQQCLLAHPLVRECAVRLMRAEQGSRLKCYIVLEDHEEEVTETVGKKILLQYCREKLTAPQRPKKIDFGPKLPTNAQGKLQDW